MSSASTTATEDVRLRALLEADILDSAPEELYDRIADVAAEMCNAPIAFVSFIADDRVWFKAHHGSDLQELLRSDSFCDHIVTSRDVLVVHDALADIRFASLPLVVGPLGVRFYAGAPVTTHDGRIVGTVCVLDTKPRVIDARTTKFLQILAQSVSSAIDLRRNQHMVHDLLAQVHERTSALERVTDTAMRLLSVIAHDVRGPLTSIVTLLSDRELVAEASQELPWILDEIQAQAIVGRDLLDQILNWARTMLRGGPTMMEDVDLHFIIDEVVRIHREHAERKGTRILIEHGVDRCDIDPNLIRFFVHTLVSNAVKFTEGGRITVRTRNEPSGLVIEVRDTGLGMPPNVRTRLFDWSRRGGIPGTRREKGAGLGLLLVKDFLDMIGGTISIASAPNDGTTVTITVPRTKPLGT